MIATSEQAIEMLRHKRTGEHLPTKKVGRNTRLVYYCDELCALRFHATDIAYYLPNGVRIDTRDDNGFNWFTVTTWARIEEFTPARTYQHHGLRYVGGRLYVPGMTIDPSGNVTDDSPALLPELETEVARTIERLPRKLRRHAEKVVKRWIDEWAQDDACCTDLDNHDGRTHYLGHVEANEPAIPPQLNLIMEMGRREHRFGDRLQAYGTEMFTRLLRNSLVPCAIKLLAPGLPYPQHTRN